MSEIIAQKSFQDSRRIIKISPEAHQQLEEIAKTYKCTHKGKASIPDLLCHISDGRLEVSKPRKTYVLNNSVVQLEIDVVIDCNGVLKEIANRIQIHGGNIHRAEAKQYNLRSSVNIVLSLPTRTNLLKLAKNLQKITFKDVQKYNTKQQIEKALRLIEYEKFASHEKHNRFVVDVTPFVGSYEKMSVIADIAYVFSVKIVAHEKLGVLHSICSFISERYISIRSIWLESLSENLVEIDLLLGLNLESIENPSGIENIKKFLMDLQMHKDIQSVEHI